MLKYLSKFNLVSLIIAILTFILGFQIGHYDVSLKWKSYNPAITFQNQNPPTGAKDVDFKLFWSTWNLLSEEYVDKKALDPQKMYYGAIQGMVSAVGDPYTVFLPPEAQKSTKEELGGSFEGVGIQLGYDKDKRLVVVSPLQGTPAEQAGVQPGDLILKIGSKDTTNLTLPDAVSLIRGPKGSSIALEIYHDGDTKAKTVSLKRDTIVVKSAEFQPKTTPNGKNVAYIKLSRFGERTFAEWNEAVSDALASGAQGIVLDMRNNPGGFLDGAVFIGSEFIGSGNVVQQEDSTGTKKGYPVNRVGKFLNLPVVVLINKGSASASEIVAGALQDTGRGKLIGDQSFGKGTIQESQELTGGTGIHITTAKWLTPKGRWIHQKGLTPDIKVEAGTDASKDPQLDKALEILDQE